MADVSLKDRLAYVDQAITKTTEKGFLDKEDIQTFRKLQGELKKIHEETEKLNAEVADLKAENIKLKKELENLREQVNTQEGRISQLLEENTVLKQDNVGLKGRLERLEVDNVGLKRDNVVLKQDIVVLNQDNVVLKQDNVVLKQDNVVLKGKVERLEVDNVGLKGKVERLEVENVGFKQDNVGLKGKVERLEVDNVGLKGKVERLEDRLSHLGPLDDELVLGELCWSIQSMIFKRVLPLSEYDDRMGYNLRYIQENINSLEDEHIEVARQAWDKLQQELNYQQRDIKRLTSILREIQSTRNLTAHPELTEQIINDLAERMKGEGKLKSWPYKKLPELISLWKKLKAMD